MKKKAQAGMFEIIMVLFVFFLLVGFGLIFYAGMQKRSSAEDSKSALELRAVRVAQIASTLPELQCSLDNAVRENCVELQKISSAEKVMQQNAPEYYDIFGYGEIYVEKMYPEQPFLNPSSAEKNKLILYRNTGGKRDVTAIQIPVTIYDSVERKSYFGVLNVLVYS